MKKHGREETSAQPKAYLRLCAGAVSLGVSCLGALDARAEAKPDSPLFDLAAQSTFVTQANAGFHSPYRGPNSLTPSVNGRETWDVTVYAGLAPWTGGELWINPEIDQGFGLSDTLGVAGFPSGEAYKVGRANPYARLQRLFFRQTIAFGATEHTSDAALNQFAGEPGSDRMVLTLGKFSAVDIFDVNQYAHDPRGDFLNWSIIDAGTFDYAADAWGYSSGAAVEFYRGPVVVRVGDFNLSEVPNSVKLGHDFSQYQLIGELEDDYAMAGRAGSARVTVFASHGRMGRLRDAIALALTEGQPADIEKVRRMQTRTGISLDLEQSLSDDLGFFLRAGWADGRFEAYEFSDIDRTLSLGLSFAGARWARQGDTFGAALVINQASRDRQDFLKAGGLGILVGDGKLPHPGAEYVVETYYDFAPLHGVHLSLDLQGVANPGYNRDRGPVMLAGFRLHAATR
jgi:high affinity Mn2+ porin